MPSTPSCLRDHWPTADTARARVSSPQLPTKLNPNPNSYGLSYHIQGNVYENQQILLSRLWNTQLLPVSARLDQVLSSSSSSYSRLFPSFPIYFSSRVCSCLVIPHFRNYKLPTRIHFVAKFLLKYCWKLENFFCYCWYDYFFVRIFSCVRSCGVKRGGKKKNGKGKLVRWNDTNSNDDDESFGNEEGTH